MDNILELCEKWRQLKQKKNTTEGAKLYREANRQVKEDMRKAKRHGLKNNAEVSKKTCRKTAARKPTSLWKNWQTWNKGELLPSGTKQRNVSQKNKKSWRGGQRTVPNCIHTTTGDSKVLYIPPPINNDSYPILLEEVEAAVKSLKKGKLREEVEAAVESLKKGKSAGVDNIPLELVQAGGEAMIDIYYSSSAIRPGRQVSGQHHGLGPWSSLSQRKATNNYAKTTIPSAWSVIQVRSC